MAFAGSMFLSCVIRFNAELNFSILWVVYKQYTGLDKKIRIHYSLWAGTDQLLLSSVLYAFQLNEICIIPCGVYTKIHLHDWMKEYEYIVMIEW